MAINLTEYWAELAKKTGLSEEKAKLVSEALNDETVQKAFKEGFKALPDYSRDLDSVRDRAKADSAAEVEKKYSEWYQRADSVYKQNLAIQDQYKKYQELYGDIDTGNGNPPEKGMTKAELETFLAERDKARDQLYINLQKQMSRITSRHVATFKEELDTDALEKLALERGVDVATAYDLMIKPRVEEQRTTEWEAKVKAAREEGARDALSRVNVPIDTKPKDPSLFTAAVGRKPDESPLEAETKARDAFLAGYKEWEQKDAT